MDGYMAINVKTTPFFLEGKEINLEKIGKTLSNYMYVLKQYPSEGFFPFVNDDSYKNDVISIRSLENNLSILPFRMRYDKLDAHKRKGLTTSQWDNLPPSYKFITKNYDAIIIDDDKKLVLVSQTWNGDLNYIKKHFFEHHAFSENKYNFSLTSSNFQISSDLFKWLCYKYFLKNSKINNLEITDISKVNVIIERTSQEAMYKGDGVLNTLDEIKLSIKNKRIFYEMTIGLNYKGNEYEFRINRDGQTFLSIYSCTGYRGLTDYNRTLNLLVDIYRFIIPEIKSLYNNDKQWDKQERVKFEKWCNDQVKNQCQ
jgi:hypothetical protein